jgi:hypothetical protein
VLFDDSKTASEPIMNTGFLIAKWIALLFVAASPVFASRSRDSGSRRHGTKQDCPAWPLSRRHGLDSGWGILNG